MCQCRFSLESMKLKMGNYNYYEEEYSLPCEVARDFLSKLDPALHADRFPMHRVKKYELQQGEHLYSKSIPETSAKTAAKIDLFIKNPVYLFNSNGMEKKF